MNTGILPFTTTSTRDPLRREWVLGMFAGLKKDYKLFKNINGTAMVMARIINPDNNSPYSDVVNVRFGFEFPMKRKSDTPKGMNANLTESLANRRIVLLH